MLEKIVTGIGVGVLGILIIAILGLVLALPLYFLWNWLMPEIFGIKVITYWQAWGIYFFSGMLFRNSNFNFSHRE